MTKANYHQQINAHEVVLGRHVILHPTARISGPNGEPALRVEIGDCCYIGEGVQIRCAEFSLGDYGRIHQYTTIHGYKPCAIGHNTWIGQGCVIDSIGGMSIGHNCGIGASSQLWSHIKYGDTLAGCRFLSEKSMSVGKDVWFVGHCIVSPIVAADRSMAMAGSVITKNMAENTIYAGVPAVEISSKIGPQFLDVNVDEQMAQMCKYVEEANVHHAVAVVANRDEAMAFGARDRSLFIIESRTYTKRLTIDEIAFMKFLLPHRAKFTPDTSGLLD